MRQLAIATIILTGAALSLASCQKDEPIRDENTVIVSNDDGNVAERICYDADQRRVACPEQ